MVTAQIQWLFYFQKASLKYLQFVQKHLKVSRTLHCKFNLKAHTWNNINISSWQKQKKKIKKQHFLLWFLRKTLAVGRRRNVRTSPVGSKGGIAPLPPCRRRAPPCGGFTSPAGECFSRRNKIRKKKMTNEKQPSFKHMQKFIGWIFLVNWHLHSSDFCLIWRSDDFRLLTVQTTHSSFLNWPLGDQTSFF